MTAQYRTWSGSRTAAWVGPLIRKIALDVETETGKSFVGWCTSINPDDDDTMVWLREHCDSDEQVVFLLDAIDNVCMNSSQNISYMSTEWMVKEIQDTIYDDLRDERSRYVSDDSLTPREMGEVRASTQSFYVAIDRQIETILDVDDEEVDIIKQGSHPHKNKIAPSEVAAARSSLEHDLVQGAKSVVDEEGFVWDGHDEYNDDLVCREEFVDMIRSYMFSKFREILPQWKPVTTYEEYTAEQIDVAITGRVRDSWALGGAHPENRGPTNNSGKYGNSWFDERTDKMRVN